MKKNNKETGEDLKETMEKELILDKKLQKKSPEIKIEKIKINPTKPLEWIPAMSVEEKTIDSQHKKLISQTNKLSKQIEEGKELDTLRDTVHFLYKYTGEHFKYEEGYMLKNGYPKLKEHQKEHVNFIKFFDKFKSDFEKSYRSEKKNIRDDVKKLCDKSKKFLGEWLVKHTLGMDQEYHSYISNKGKEPSKGKTKDSTKFDMASIKREIETELKGGRIKPHEAEIKEQRAPLKHVVKNTKDKMIGKPKEYIQTGVPGFDDLFTHGIPSGNSVLVAGGAGSGKTIFCIQTLVHHAEQGKKCLIMSLEENEERLIQHMEDFGWDARKLIKKGNLKIVRINPFDITRNVDALLAKQRGELLIDIEPVILPKDFTDPDFIAIDSLTAIASAFTGKDESYRIYIEQLFRFLENTKATNYLITETEQVPKIFSPTGVEEFLADGVIVLYNFKRGDVREKGIEVLKMRGENHEKKIVAASINDQGLVIYPEQEVFSNLD